MDLRLTEAVVLITGGSKGIGLACAKAFAAEGARVAIASRSSQHLANAVESLRASGVESLAVPADLGRVEDARNMVQSVESQFGPIDILVNSAGAANRTPPDELTAAHWHAAMDAKYFTYVHAIDAVIGGMAGRGSGSIVNIVGMGGKVASPTHLPGGAANAALMLASVGLANAYAPRGVRVNAVNPGLTLTERLREGLEAEARLAGGRPEDILEQHKRRLPLGRIAEPHEIADVVVFVASPRASHLTGAVISLDGAATPMVV